MRQEQKDTNWVSVTLYAEAAGRDPRTVRRWIKRGDIPAVKHGLRGHYQIPRSEYDRLLLLKRGRR